MQQIYKFIKTCMPDETELPLEVSVLMIGASLASSVILDVFVSIYKKICLTLK